MRETVEIEKKKAPGMFELKPLDPKHRIKGGVFGKGRIMLGRSESCDLIVAHEPVSAIHAVMEISDDRAIIYDMNSTNGTYVNGEKVVAKEVRVGDTFSLSDVDFKFIRYVMEDALPPVLDLLEPEHGAASVKAPPTAPKVSRQMPSVVYPLAADPRAEFSEYIFEEREVLYPIFKYEATKQSVEVIILFKDSIFSIDYLSEGRFTYHICGVFGNSKELEFPYLGKKDKFPFVDVGASSATVHTIPGFGIFHLSDKKPDTGHVAGSIELAGQDIVRLQKDDIQIFVRHVAAPPKVAAAPILKRDPDFQKYLIVVAIFLLAVFIGFNTIEVPEDEKKDELAPERLATILYKQPLNIVKTEAIAKTKNAPKVVQKSPQQVVPKTAEAQPKLANEVIENKVKDQKEPGKKTAPKKKIVKQGTVPPKDLGKMASPPKSDKAGTPGAAAFAQVESKSQGHVEVYKSADFSTSINSLVAKGGSLSGVKTQGISGSGSGDFKGVSGAGVGSGSGDIKTVGMVTNQGSLVGATTGVLGESKGAEGLSSKRSIYTAGIPSETVVLGSMDPDVIRRILLEHLPQFRFCYQKELDSTGQEATGTIKLNFTIGASGHVAQAGVDGSSSLPTDVKKCVVGVLKGITFPEPMGGGTVEVKQPMNFYPKKI